MRFPARKLARLADAEQTFFGSRITWRANRFKRHKQQHNTTQRRSLARNNKKDYVLYICPETLIDIPF